MLKKLVNLVPGISGTGVRTFENGDACFAGHFPKKPILPGVLIIEALAQTAMAVLATADSGEPVADSGPKLGYLVKIDKASFYQPIVPGDEVHFHIEIGKRIRGFVMVSGRVTRDGKDIGKAQLTLASETHVP